MYYSSDEDDGGNEDEAMHDVRDINSLRLKKSPVGTSNSPGIQHAVSMVDTDWKRRSDMQERRHCARARQN